MNKSVWYSIGLMSGTSLDGLDICYVKFSKDKNYSFEIIKADTIQYPEKWNVKLKNAFTSDARILSEMDIEYGAFLGEKVNEFIKRYSIRQVDFVASHGHTIFHKPEEGITLQIGSGEQIAKKTDITTVCDFRTQDVKLGGQGAPLVPIGDELLFHNYDYCLNLGGFANVSYAKDGKRIAFDICPVNIVLNYYTRKIGLPYDDKGSLAVSGTINEGLLKALNELDFYKQNHPKSLGLEWVEAFIFPLIDSYGLETKDILRTYVEHVAYQIAKVIQQDSTVLITGGGAFNSFLIERLEFYLQQQLPQASKLLIDFKEALIFAFLGLLRLTDQINVLSSVTGAKKDHSSGAVYNP
jgi:anhydro-N-acetylmuramic acid kinase